MGWPLWVGSRLFPQMEIFRCLRVLFMNQGNAVDWFCCTWNILANNEKESLREKFNFLAGLCLTFAELALPNMKWVWMWDRWFQKLTQMVGQSPPNLKLEWYGGREFPKLFDQLISSSDRVYRPLNSTVFELDRELLSPQNAGESLPDGLMALFSYIWTTEPSV